MFLSAATEFLGVAEGAEVVASGFLVFDEFMVVGDEGTASLLIVAGEVFMEGGVGGVGLVGGVSISKTPYRLSSCNVLCLRQQDSWVDILKRAIKKQRMFLLCMQYYLSPLYQKMKENYTSKQFIYVQKINERVITGKNWL